MQLNNRYITFNEDADILEIYIMQVFTDLDSQTSKNSYQHWLASTFRY